MRRIGVAVIAALVSVFALHEASAQSFPNRRITILVPFTPGTAFDIVARAVAPRLQERWGQPVVVENKPGVSGALATEQVANAPADGYTLVTIGAPQSAHPSLVKNLRYDPVKDLTPVGIIAKGGVALTVNPNVVPAKTFGEFVAAVREKPGFYNHSSPGSGTLQHLGFELMKQQLGLQMQHVPYRGQAQAITDFIAGQVHAAYLPSHTARPHHQAEKLRILAIAGSKRLAILPEVPILAELGYPTLDFELWFGLAGPANLPDAIRRQFEEELKLAVATPEVRDALEKQGLTPAFVDGAATAAHLASEITRWRAVVEKAGMQPE
jgi:tripartite-type tricarboxylate transporter receptor subunit TctC